jgi:hypothetical protein
MTIVPTHFRLVPMAITFLVWHIRECFLVLYSQSPRHYQYRAMAMRMKEVEARCLWLMLLTLPLFS